MWISYLKIAFRILVRNRRFSIINLIGLTLGLTSFIVIFAWIQDEVTFDRFHQKKDRIVQLAIKHPDGTMDSNAPYAMAPNMAVQYPEIDSYSMLMRMESRMQCSFIFHSDSVEPVKAYEPSVVRVDTSFFTIFDFPSTYGSKENFLTQPDAVVISSRIARIYYPGFNPIGRTLIFNNQALLTISGVVDIPRNSAFQFDFFIPTSEDHSNDWNWRDPSYLLLNHSTNVQSFEEKIATYLNDHYPGTLPDEFQVKLISIKKTHLTFGGKGKVWMFSMVAVLLVVVAALNYMNLATANYSRRIRETGIRMVLGARRREIMMHFFFETTILAFGAMLTGLFLAELITPAMSPLLGKDIEIGYMDHPVIIVIFILIAFLISALASIYPSMFFTRSLSTTVLSSSSQPATRRSVLLVTTTIIQFTLSIALMISSLIVIWQIRYTSKADLGFSVDQVISIPMNQGIGNNFLAFLDRLEQHPDIIMVSAGQSYPYQEDFKTNIDWSTKNDPSEWLFRYSICLNNYPDLFDMELLEGRMFSDDFGADMNKYVINETAAQIFGFDDPQGQTISMWGRTGEVIGVVKDFHHVSLHREILPHVFNIHPSNYDNLRFIFIEIGKGNTSETLSYIETACNEFAPDYPFSYTFLEEDIGNLYAADQNLSRILVIFALLALIVSSLGIYGLAFYSAEKRTKAITIRKVFGAGFGNVLWIFYRQMLIRIGFSLIFAIGVSMVIMTRWLQNFAYQMKPDPMIYAGPALLAFLVAGVATLIAIWRSIIQSPAQFLKQE